MVGHTFGPCRPIETVAAACSKSLIFILVILHHGYLNLVTNAFFGRPVIDQIGRSSWAHKLTIGIFKVIDIFVIGAP